LQSPEALAKIRRCTACHFQAPTVFLLCYDSSDIWHRPFDGWEAGYTDCASVVTHILLAATDLGLGTCWVAYFDPKAVIKEFNLPANLVPAALIPCGYPAQGPCDRHNDRRAISELVKFL